MIFHIVMVILFNILMGLTLSIAHSQSLIDESYVEYVNQLFKNNGIKKGYVEIDKYGRLKLSGEYEDEIEVDRAFILAQSVVGPKWVSPVTPENIKVKEWEKQFANSMLKAGKRYIQEVKDYDISSVPVKNRYALIVGIGEFEHKGIKKIDYATKDANSFYEFLTGKEGKFDKNKVILLLNEEATYQKITYHLKKIASEAQEDDLVVIFFSTHGTQPNKNGNIHIVTYDTKYEKENMENIWYTSISDQELLNFIKDLKAKRLVIILDVCYSSAVYRKIPGILPKGGNSIGVTDVESYGISTGYVKFVTGAKNIYTEDNLSQQTCELSKSKDAKKDGSGIVILASSRENQLSWESPKKKHGYFTYYLLKGLRLYNGSIRDAFCYAKPMVEKHVKKEKGQIQTPSFYATNQNWNIRIK